MDFRLTNKKHRLAQGRKILESKSKKGRYFGCALVVLLILYLLILFFVMPFSFGQMVRHEISFSVFQQYPIEIFQHGPKDGPYVIFSYLVFYSGLYSVPYMIQLGVYSLKRNPDADALRQAGIAFVFTSLWIMVTLILFSDAIIDFFANLPALSEGWGFLGVLEALWVITGIGAYYAWDINIRHQ